MYYIPKQINNNQYIIDSYYGLIYHKDKQEIAKKYKTNDIRLIRYYMRDKLVKSKSSLIDTIFIQPNGSKCLGSCVYCMNESFENNYNALELLAPERLATTLSYLKEHFYLSPSNINLSFTGGEPCLHPNLSILVDASLNIIPSLFSVSVTTGLFYTDIMLHNLISFMKECSTKPIRTTGVSFSIDLDGSKNRYSTICKLNNDDNFRRTKELLPDLMTIPNTSCCYNTRLNNDSNVSLLIDNIHALFNINNKIVVRLSIVDGPTHFLDVEHIGLFFKELKKNFNISFTHKGAFTIEITSKEIDYKFNNLMLLTLEDDIFVLHPLDQRCWTWSKFFGIGPKKYFSCYFGFYESDNIDDCIYISEDNPYYLVYNKLPLDCQTCEYLSFCKLCPRQRNTYPCSQIPAMKEYMKQVFDIMISTPEKWCIE
jgi:sulfatase maturation enzyme AslB (radical SAM superfamily)